MIRHSRPMRTLCAIWTRLSIFVPAPIDRVVDAAAVDRRVRADLDVVLDDAAADMRNLEMLPVALHVAESVRPDARARRESSRGSPMTRAAVHRHRRDTDGSRRRCRTPAPIDRSARRSTTESPSAHAVADHRVRPDRDVARRDVAPHADDRRRCTPRAAASDAMKPRQQRQQRLLRLVDDDSRPRPVPASRPAPAMTSTTPARDDAEHRRVLGRAEEAQVARRRAVQRRHAAHDGRRDRRSRARRLPPQ